MFPNGNIDTPGPEQLQQLANSLAREDIFLLEKTVDAKQEIIPEIAGERDDEICIAPSKLPGVSARCAPSSIPQTLGNSVLPMPETWNERTSVDMDDFSSKRKEQALLLSSVEELLERQHAKLKDFLDFKLGNLQEDLHASFSAAFLDAPHSPPQKVNSSLGASSPAANGSPHSGQPAKVSSALLEKKRSSGLRAMLNVNPNLSVKKDLPVTTDKAANEAAVSKFDMSTSPTNDSKPSGEDESIEEGSESLEANPDECMIARWVHHRLFDIFIGLLVVLNVLLMFLQLEQKGAMAGEKLQLLPHSKVWADAAHSFDVLEHCFNISFVLELVLRLAVDGRLYFYSIPNLLDLFIVVTTCLDAYILKALMHGEGGANLNFARMARLLKLVKFMRAFRVAVLFSELRVLIRTLLNSMMALVWSAVLLGFIMVAGGILMAQLVTGFVEDESGDYERRVWTWKHYGTGLRSTWTMFEATLSGGWPNYARPLIEEVNSYYALFWILYVLVVVFAVIRVITALFLQKTMESAKGDEEMMMLQKMQHKESYMKKIKAFLVEADEDGDGTMDKTELRHFLKHPNFQRSLHGLGLEQHEVVGMFSVLDDGDGIVEHDEFIAGCMRLTGGARAIDSVLIMHEQNKIAHKVNHISSQIAFASAC